MKIRIVLADDPQILRQGLRRLLSAQRDFEVIAEAQDGRSAGELAERLMPDVVVIDIAMPGLNGVEATRQIVERVSGVRGIATEVSRPDAAAVSSGQPRRELPHHRRKFIAMLDQPVMTAAARQINLGVGHQAR